MQFGNSILSKLNKADRQLTAQLKQILAFSPDNIHLYKAAITHPSKSNSDDSNYERLEFLGDAYLGSIVAEYLFKKYPKEAEGFLTEMRSKIVSKNSLNQLAIDIGLSQVILYDKQNQQLKYGKMLGNALEALIGAIYLDKGYKVTKKFVINQLIKHHLDINEIESTETNFKKGIYTWAQKLNKSVAYKVEDETDMGKRKVFKVAIYIDDVKLVDGTGWNKKRSRTKCF